MRSDSRIIWFFRCAYGAVQYFNGGARCDLFGFSPGTGGWLLQPLTDKREQTVQAGIKALRGPAEDVRISSFAVIMQMRSLLQ